jgi:hypothetical protein
MPRSRTSFQKRQKELARKEKQRDKVAKRMERKLAPKQPDTEDLPVDESLSPLDGALPAETPGAVE